MDTSIIHDLIKHTLYHSRTIWLFTRSDLKTIVIPSTLFAIVYTSSEIISRSTSSDIHLWTFCKSLLLTTFWIWINLLPFTIENQRQPGSIREDAENKPWRPLPARRISPRHATALMIFSYTTAVLASFVLGASVQCIALIFLGSWYNHLHGGNRSMIARNLLNGCGYICFTSGALDVMTIHGLGFSIRAKAFPWALIIGAVVSSSIHMLDLPDQIGDRARDRRTIPLVYGDNLARWSVAVTVAFWSLCCPAFWHLGVAGYMVPATLGGVVVSKVLLHRTVPADKRTSLLYNVWIAGLFCLPLASALS